MCDDAGVSPGQLILLEYKTLKQEQLSRIGVRDNLIYATLAALAAVVAAVASSKNYELLLLLPPASAVLGWTYLANDQKISDIGQHIRQTLIPALAQLIGSDDVFAWEVAHRSKAGRLSLKYGQLVVDLLTFCVPGFASLITYWIAASSIPIGIVVSALDFVIVAGLTWQIILAADLAKNDASSPSQQAPPPPGNPAIP